MRKRNVTETRTILKAVRFVTGRLLLWENTMIGMRLHHPQSGITGVIDAESVQPDASVLVRICDMWFEASSLVSCWKEARAI